MEITQTAADCCSVFLPRTTDPEGAPRPEIPNIKLDEQSEPCFAELQAIQMVWVQITRGAGLG